MASLQKGGQREAQCCADDSFVMRNCVVICLKTFLKGLVPYPVEPVEMFADKAIETLGTTLDNHVD
jgi:hypothetical protein